MNENIAIWNVLHDGEITAVQHNGETLTMVINIPYLRRRIQPVGDSFVLRLTGLSLLEYRDYDSTVSFLAAEVESAMPAILSTDSEAMPVTLYLSTGQLILDFKGIRFTLDTGEPVDFETIHRAAVAYWTEWEKKAEQARGHTR